LQEILTSRSQRIARDAVLRVTFNPKTVLEYRLLGHEANQWAGLLPASPGADFRAGQSATALYEVRLAGTGPADVATADLSWYPADSRLGKGVARQTVSVRLDRNNIAQTFAKSSLSLQEAALVAQTAEVLRRSPFVSARWPHVTTHNALVRLAELSGQMDTQLYQRPSFVDFVSFLREASRAKANRRTRDR